MNTASSRRDITKDDGDEESQDVEAQSEESSRKTSDWKPQGENTKSRKAATKTTAISKEMYNQQMMTHLPHLKKAFSPKLIRRCLFNSLCRKVIEINNGKPPTTTQLRDFVQMVMFSRRDRVGKEVFSS